MTVNTFSEMSYLNDGCSAAGLKQLDQILVATFAATRTDNHLSEKAFIPVHDWRSHNKICCRREAAGCFVSLSS